MVSALSLLQCFDTVGWPCTALVADNESIYLTMAAIICCFLSIPASSVPLERLFSATWLLITKSGTLGPIQVLIESPIGQSRLGNEIYHDLTSVGD